MNDSGMTVVGNLVNDPETRVLPSGVSMTTFRVASTPRHYDRAASEWRDGPTLFLPVTCWRGLADHVADLRKGDPVVVIGRLVGRTYETTVGERRYVCQLEASVVGPDLNRARVTVTRTTPQQRPGDADPWATASTADAGPFTASVAAASTDEPAMGARPAA